MPTPERIQIDDDGVVYFEHPLGALLDYTADLVNDPTGSWLGSATVATGAYGVTVTPTNAGLKVGNNALTYTPAPQPGGPGGAVITVPAPAEAAGKVTLWLWTDQAAAPAVGATFDVEVWFRTTTTQRVSRAKFRIKIV